MPDRTPRVHSRSTRVPLCGQMRWPMCPVPSPWHAVFFYNSQAARHMAHTQLPYLYL